MAQSAIVDCKGLSAYLKKIPSPANLSEEKAEAPQAADQVAMDFPQDHLHGDPQEKAAAPQAADQVATDFPQDHLHGDPQEKAEGHLAADQVATDFPQHHPHGDPQEEVPPVCQVFDSTPSSLGYEDYFVRFFEQLQ